MILCDRTLLSNKVASPSIGWSIGQGSTIRWNSETRHQRSRRWRRRSKKWDDRGQSQTNLTMINLAAPEKRSTTTKALTKERSASSIVVFVSLIQWLPFNNKAFRTSPDDHGTWFKQSTAGKVLLARGQCRAACCDWWRPVRSSECVANFEKPLDNKSWNFPGALSLVRQSGPNSATTTSQEAIRAWSSSLKQMDDFCQFRFVARNCSALDGFHDSAATSGRREGFILVKTNIGTTMCWCSEF